MPIIDNPWQAMALNNAWANATLYAAIKGMSDKAFAAQRPGFFGSLSRTLNHIHEVDLFYIDALEQGGLGRKVYDREDIAQVEKLAAAQAEADLRLAGFCHKLTQDRLSNTVPTQRKSGVVEERVDALLLHLFQHQVHHRGQAHVMVQHAGIEPPQLDEFYLEFERAPAAKAYWA